MQYTKDYQKLYITGADTNQIISSVTLADGDFPLDGNIDVPRNITIDVTSATVSAGTITVTGINFVTGLSDTEVLDLSDTNTLVGTKIFSTITSVVVAGLADEDPGDTFIVGVGTNVQVTVGKSILHYLIVGGGSGTVGSYVVIDGTSGTTANVATLKSGIAVGTYIFHVSIAKGLRVIVAGTEPLTVTYSKI